MEKSYKQLSPTAKRGINKFTRMSLKEMKAVGDAYEKKTGKSAYNVLNKEGFYKFVAKRKIKL
jgi:hypothetical protein